MASKSFSFQSRDRTFIVSISSSLEGYTGRVTEEIFGGGIVQIALARKPQFEITPSQFYRERPYYRGILVGEITGELRYGPLDRLKDGINEKMLAQYDGYIRANLRGWPSGFPDAIDDDLENWDF